MEALPATFLLTEFSDLVLTLPDYEDHLRAQAKKQMA